MVKKWQGIEESMNMKEIDYDDEVKLCLQSLLKMTISAMGRDE